MLLLLWPIEPLLLAAGLWLSELPEVDGGGPMLSEGAVLPLMPCEVPALAVPEPLVADGSDGPLATPVEAALLLLEPGSLLAVRVSLLRCAQAPSPIRLVAASAIPR
ncbi:MAG TPA: hypothetical protein VN883_01845 [Myxococcales bacterium]|nr:hypothetical protein [Myxococcales bacterium]